MAIQDDSPEVQGLLEVLGLLEETERPVAALSG